MLTDANGLPLAVVSDGANVHDIKLVHQTLNALECYRPPLKVPLYIDKGYTGQWLHDELLVRWEKKIENFEAMLHFACGLIVWNKSLLG